LGIAAFLVVAGLTGSVLAFYQELDELLNPRLHRPGTTVGRPLDPFMLRERVAAAVPDHPVHFVPLRDPRGKAVVFWLDGGDSGDDEWFADPVSGEILGSRRWGDLGQGFRLNLVPFVYRLHYSLGLREFGSWLFGIVALLWTADCFVGAALTFPVGRTAGAASPVADWARRWRVSWLVKGGELFRAVFTFHRAAGLWVWAFLFVFAWSAVGFNLQPVFRPVMGVLGHEDVRRTLPEREEPMERPGLEFRAAREVARTRMAEEAAERGFAIKEEGFLEFDAKRGLYRYSVHGSRDPGDRWPGTHLWIDADTGMRVAFSMPTGQTAGGTMASWLFALHTGAVGGWPYRIVVFLFGWVVAGLAGSGVWIWWWKRSRKVRRGQRAGA
jgi:uncharacterized iron-regulated membrane protein